MATAKYSNGPGTIATIAIDAVYTTIDMTDQGAAADAVRSTLDRAEDPAAALAEAHRILRPGGKLLLLDLRQHEEAWVRQTLGDRWLGFDDRVLHDMLSAAGFTDITVRAGASRAGDPFAVLIASGVKTALRKGRS